LLQQLHAMKENGVARKLKLHFERIAAVAHLLVQHGKPAHIAKKLKLKRFQVTRLKHAAEASGLLTVATPSYGPNWNARSERAARRILDRDSKLLEVLRRAEKSGILIAPLTCRVILSLDDSGENWPRRLAHFGAECAPYVRRLVHAASSVGVSWGETLECVISGIERLPPVRGRDRPAVLMIPVCGEPLDGLPNTLSASTLSFRLARAIDGPRARALSFSAVPFMVPLDFAGPEEIAAGKAKIDEVAIVKKLCRRIPAFRETMGGPDGAGENRADHLSAVLTSVGLDGAPYGMRGRQFLKSCGMEADRFAAVAVADISGLLLDLPPAQLNQEQRALLKRVRSHWTGLSIEQLLGCAKRGRDGRRKDVGVIVIAAGSAKAPVILECMSRKRCSYGLITHLIIDSDLEAALIELINRRLAGGAQVN
jgi:DNA-binding transcriptional regulator LsrR (DeoR family)